MREKIGGHGEWKVASLKTAEEIADRVKMTAERLRELAEIGVCPHYRVDGGEPLFRLVETQAWVKANLTKRCDGGPIPWTVNVTFAPLAHETDTPAPPAAIASIGELLTLSGRTPPGIYFLCRGNAVVYVGQSLTPTARVGQHCVSKDFDRAYLLPVPRAYLNRVESAMIRALQPELNRGAPTPDTSGDGDALARYGLFAVEVRAR